MVRFHRRVAILPGACCWENVELGELWAPACQGDLQELYLTSGRAVPCPSPPLRDFITIASSNVAHQNHHVLLPLLLTQECLLPLLLLERENAQTYGTS